VDESFVTVGLIDFDYTLRPNNFSICNAFMRKTYLTFGSKYFKVYQNHDMSPFLYFYLVSFYDVKTHLWMMRWNFKLKWFKYGTYEKFGIFQFINFYGDQNIWEKRICIKDKALFVLGGTP